MPGDTKPHKARCAKAEKRKAAATAAGTLDDVRAKLWACIERVDGLVADTEAEAALVLKGTHALTQACSAYVKIVEAAELEARVAALEEASAQEPQTLRRAV